MQKNELQYLSDYVAIRQLNAKYNRYADLADGTSYSNLFTEDAQFNIVGEGTEEGWRYHRRRVELDLDINAVVEKVK
ncbi:MAG: nuclear transport factor 2 family protein [Halioglobus sp.]|nr:nuclear transport factor 2 family protein [Halioglobus sp.]